MIETKDAPSRRTFLKDSGRVAGVSTLAGMTLPYVHAAENNTIQLALVGCGGRGTGAVENALGIKNGPIKLVAMADVFPQKLSDSHGRLRGLGRGRHDAHTTGDLAAAGEVRALQYYRTAATDCAEDD